MSEHMVNTWLIEEHREPSSVCEGMKQNTENRPLCTW